MAQVKYLYSVYLPEGRTRTVLDAIRFFAKPTTKHPAHVTVRGPYPEPIDGESWSAILEGREVEVAGVGTFFEGHQNTVFLGVASPAIKAAWDKPDYPDYNPHLTIYDGPSRPLAEAIRDAISPLAVHFTFPAGRLEPMLLGQGSATLKDGYRPERLGGMLTNPPTADEVALADEATRVTWIRRLTAFLPGLAAATPS